MENKQTEVVLLFSGGFDSTVLLNTLLQAEYKVHALFFDYGQRAASIEYSRVRYWYNKFPEDLSIQKITIPTLSWCKSSTTNNEDNESSEYVAARNTIFLSYALSYAEANGIKDIYTGFIGPDNYYPDTSPTYVSMMNVLGNMTAGINVHAPFVFDGKDDVFDTAQDLGFDVLEILNHTVSCNKIEDLQSCGECLDCKAREVYYNRILP